MRPTKANLECADVILSRNHLPPSQWPDLRRDIALAIDLAEQEMRKKPRGNDHAVEKGRVKDDGKL